MAMVCPKCTGRFEHKQECPKCGVPLENDAFGHDAPSGMTRLGSGWQHSAVGRVVVGVLLAQGLTLGLRTFFSAGMVALPVQEESDVWPTLYDLLLRQGLEVLCLVIACVLAGAGQPRGIFVGAIIGLVNAVILLGLAQAQHQPVNEVAVYAQPLLHAFIGAAGGFFGSLIWRPLPELHLAAAGIRKAIRPVRTSQFFAGPIYWLRVLLGTAVVVAGVLSPAAVLNFLINTTDGQLRISSQLQSTLITWELIGLFILLGSVIAGFNTLNGPKQGLCVGIAASFLIAGFQLSSSKMLLEEILFTAFVIMTLSLVGSWFSCRLFPPVVRVSHRHRMSESP